MKEPRKSTSAELIANLCGSLCVGNCGGARIRGQEEGLPDVGSSAEEMDSREQEDEQLTATCPSGVGKTGLI